MAQTPHRWVARPVEVEALPWTGDFDALPVEWQTHPFIACDERGVVITTIEGDTGRPDIGDYMVWGCASELYWSPPKIHAERWKPIGGNRWVALPVLTEAILWTGRRDGLPSAWRNDPHFAFDASGLALTNYRGAITRPRPFLDYLVQRNGRKFSKVPRAIWEYKYEQVTS